MSNGLVTVKCTNCQQETEIIPGTIVAECDHCGRLFRPVEDASAPAASPFSFGQEDRSGAVPPWEREAAPDVKPPWEDRPELSSTTPSALPMELDGKGRSARHAQEADTAAAHRRDRQEQAQREHDAGKKRPGREAADSGLVLELPEEDLVEQEQADAPSPAARPVRSQPAAPAPAASAAPAIFIFITLLVLAIGAYVMAKREEAAPSERKTEHRHSPNRSAQERGGRREAPQDEPAVVSEVPGATTEPVQPPTKSLTTLQRIGMEQVEKHSVVLSQEQVEQVKRVITHRTAQPFTSWGAETPELEVVVFVPFTNMGIARLRQMTTEFKKLEPFESRIAVWIVYNWGADKPVEAEAAELAHAIHWSFKREAMHHFVTLLQKEAIWRAGRGKLDEYVRTVGLDPVKLRESMAKLPLDQVRKEVTDLMAELHLQDKDLTFLIGGRSYLDGKTLYHVSKIVDYELAAREP